MSVSDLSDLERTFKGAREGRRETKGIFLRTYQVNDHIELQTGFSWHNR